MPTSRATPPGSVPLDASEPLTLLRQLVAIPAPERPDALAALLPGVRAQALRAPRYAHLGRRAQNLVVGAARPRLVIGAHHDIDPGTVQGATDNAAAVAVLATLARHYAAVGWPDGLAIAFWDLEEPGNGGFADGSTAYARALRAAEHLPELVIVCDVVGLGMPWLSRRSRPVPAALLRHALGPRGHALPEVGTPGSDDAGFARLGIPAALLTTLPPDGDKRHWSVMHTPGDTIDVVDPASLTTTLDALHTLVGVTVDPVAWAAVRDAAFAEVAAQVAAEDAARAAWSGRASGSRRRMESTLDRAMAAQGDLFAGPAPDAGVRPAAPGAEPPLDEAPGAEPAPAPRPRRRARTR